MSMFTNIWSQIAKMWSGMVVRYCMVLFAGIAAEALVYGEAEGGENDENLFRSICILLQPPLSVAQVSLSPLYKTCVSLC